MIAVAETREGLTFSVHVSPGAARRKAGGEHNGALKVSTPSPPEGGAANSDVVRILAESLKLKKSQVSVQSGFKHRDKKILVTGIDRLRLEECLEALG